MATIKIPKQDMLEILADPACVVRDRITGNGRWSIHHELIFRHAEKLYRTTYRVGSTEIQDELPWEDNDQVEAKEVQEVQVSVTDYQVVA